MSGRGADYSAPPPHVPGIRFDFAPQPSPARETASMIVGLRRTLDIRLRPWTFRPGMFAIKN